MAAKRGPGLFAVGNGDDLVRGLQGHVAVDAGADDFFVELGELSAFLWLVTFHTMGGKRGGGAVGLGHVRAEGTAHVRRGFGAAPHPPAAHLVPVYSLAV